MVKVAVKDKYVEALSAFGDLNEAIEVALQRYTIEQITEKITELRKKDAMFKAKYDQDYPAFARKTAESEEYIKQIEKNVNKMWELDLAEWEFCYKGIDDWTKKLKTILMI